MVSYDFSFLQIVVSLCVSANSLRLYVVPGSAVHCTIVRNPSEHETHRNGDNSKLITALHTNSFVFVGLICRCM